MKYLLWLLAFAFLFGAAWTAAGVATFLLAPEWFCATIFCIVGMFSAVEYAEILS